MSCAYTIIGKFAHTTDGSGHTSRFQSVQDRNLRMRNGYSACAGDDRWTSLTVRDEQGRWEVVPTTSTIPDSRKYWKERVYEQPRFPN